MPFGTEGELTVASPSTTAGYVNRKELNALKFRNGWYYTGDLGVLNERGDIFITGRKDDIINVAGLKVDPLEVEAILLTHPGISDCVVVGTRHKSCGQMVCAYVVSTSDVSSAELADYCRDHLLPHKIPRQFRTIKSIPRGQTGKVLRKYLVDPALGASDMDETHDV
jgi:acyl-coenzyme A synthetase/AMP-(fatty) acid ligase